jgi:ribonucleoside-diphosphate reductase alpha chain
MADIRRWAWEASAELAAARGVYPAWTGSRHEAEFRKVRNSYVLTVAPTGTTSMIAHTSSGIEPEFSLVWHKRVMDGTLIPYVCEPFERVAREEGWWTDDLLDRITANHGSCRGLAGVPERWQRVFATAHDIAPEWHVRMQAAVQAHVDSAVSKTINLPASATVQDVANAYRLAWSLGCKGITVYRDGSRQDQVLNIGAASANGNGTPTAALRERPSARSASPVDGNGRGHTMALPSVLEAKRVRVDTPEGGIYVHIGYVDGKPVEVFTTTPEEAKHEEIYEAFSRIFSIALQHGVPLDRLLKQLDGANRKYGSVATIPAAILRAFRLTQDGARADLACPKCQGEVVVAEGCVKCRVCGWSKCE